MRRLNLEGQIFGRLTVIAWVGQGWRCVCQCGKEKIASSNSLSQGKTRSCGCLALGSKQENGRNNRKHGYSKYQSLEDQIKYQALVNIKERARRRGYESDLEIGDLPELTKSCPVLGIAYQKGSLKKKDFSPSVDRRNSNLPYLKKYKDNLVFISHRANRIKSDASMDELLKVIDYIRGVTPSE